MFEKEGTLCDNNEKDKEVQDNQEVEDNQEVTPNKRARNGGKPRPQQK